MGLSGRRDYLKLMSLNVPDAGFKAGVTVYYGKVAEGHNRETKRACGFNHKPFIFLVPKTGIEPARGNPH
jgi:hypothetical protein